MRHRSVAMVLGLLALLLLAPSAQAEPVSNPFTGTWIGSDPAPPEGDGSTVHLLITRGPSVRIAFTDEFGTVCANEGASETSFRSILTGKVEDNVLTASFKVAKCGSTVIGFLKGETVTYDYDDNGTTDPGDDTLWDGTVLWHRDS
jgi:hypothetical protein